MASAERVFELLDVEEEPVEQAEPLAVGGRGEVAFEHVSFRYEPDRPLIEDLSLVATPGQTVAIVGPTGAGKTTLVNLVMRFYDVDSGRITIDGVDISTMRRADLRGRTGMVLQDTWLFEGTIRDNIAYGRPDATEEEILESPARRSSTASCTTCPTATTRWWMRTARTSPPRAAAGHDRPGVPGRPGAADPRRGDQLVDTRTELLLQQAMAALRNDRTSFVIAHWLSTIRDADLILVMEDGAIVEQGTHHDLLAADGAYAALYNSQFAQALV